MSPIKSASITSKQINHEQASTFDSLSLMKRSLDDLMLYNSQQSSTARNSIGSIKSPFTVNKSTIALFNENNKVSSNPLTSITCGDESQVVSSVDPNKSMEAGGGGGGSNSIDSGLRGSTSGSSGEDQSIDGRKASLTVSEESASAAAAATAAATTTASRQGSSSETKLPRWCHQCGTKYPMQGAKYCYECGARRLGTLASLV